MIGFPIAIHIETYNKKKLAKIDLFWIYVCVFLLFDLEMDTAAGHS
jgi:hypothetical protein